LGIESRSEPSIYLWVKYGYFGFSPVKTEIVRPRAGSLAESMRDIGYSLETAVADILDNSITAGAKTIDIRFGWSDGILPWLAIIDDGKGMTEAELVEAMRPGSRSPLEERGIDDLGRFGLGLKTASFSQCRKLTVITRPGGMTYARMWDLDFVRDKNEWMLQTPTQNQVKSLPAVEGLGSIGTCVLWQDLDRMDLGEDEVMAHSRMNERMESIREHLALIFHRYLVDENNRKKLKIRINENPVEAFDPFNSSSMGTTQMPQEKFLVQGQRVTMQPYILPHHTKVPGGEYEKFAGKEGYLHGQGFYVYRNKRLIISGTWFRMARQEQLTKLARVCVDIPNTLDHLWTIDVRKSRAKPPEAISRRMAQLVRTIQDNSKRPYLHRGRVIQQRATNPVWQRRVSNDRVEYEVDKEHPMLAEFRGDLDDELRSRFEMLLKMISTSFPAALLFNDFSEKPKHADRGGPSDELLRNLAEVLVQNFSCDSGEELQRRMECMEPFASKPSFIREFITELFPGQESK